MPDVTAPIKPKRIFWLGMHVVLTKTELPRLRQLGYEVFNPPYLAGIYDQSANLEWDYNQHSTLPRAAFDILARTNFFYSRIPRDAAEVLNEYFDAMVITINPDWLDEVLRVYHGRVIYRTYGQPWTISEAFYDRGLVRHVQEREHFYIVPHARETAVEEHDFFTSRMRFIPYILPPDIFDHRDTWHGNGSPEIPREVMVNIPNISNPYYRNQYLHVKANFGWSYYRIYGVQPKPTDDDKVVGTLGRAALIDAYQRCCVCFYPYHDSRVCYLPPLEMMTIGGPVIYAKNSLLHRFFETACDGRPTPGMGKTVRDQQEKIEWVRQGDQHFINEVIAAQAPVRHRYSPEYVWPIFDRVMTELISDPPSTAPATFRYDPVPAAQTTHSVTATRRAYVFFHFPGHIVQFREGEYFSFEGIPRVIQKFVRALMDQTDLEIVVTCYSDQAFAVHGFFDAVGAAGRIKILPIDAKKFRKGNTSRLGRLKRVIGSDLRQTLAVVRDGQAAVVEATRAARRVFRERRRRRRRAPRWLGLPAQIGSWLFRNLVRAIDWIWDMLVALSGKLPKIWERIGRILNMITHPLGIAAALAWNGLYRFMRRIPVVRAARARIVARVARRLHHKVMRDIDADPATAFSLVPHYYLFPEAGKLRSPSVLYLPDFTPHFFPGVSFEPAKDAYNNHVGRVLAENVTAIFTNSEFSKGYLPDTVLEVPAEKITAIPIPLLVGRYASVTRDQEERLNRVIGGNRFVFYPTANRPNKQIAFLLEVFFELLRTEPELRLVLTCSLDDFGAARQAYERLNKMESAKIPAIADRVIFMQGLPDAEICWLYEHADMMLFTSTMEGNFPPQVFEAVTYGCPVIATRLPLITEVLKEAADEVLLLCDPMATEAYVKYGLAVLKDKAFYRRRQQAAYRRLMAHAGDSHFYRGVSALLKKAKVIET